MPILSQLQRYTSLSFALMSWEDVVPHVWRSRSIGSKFAALKPTCFLQFSVQAIGWHL